MSILYSEKVYAHLQAWENSLQPLQSYPITNICEGSGVVAESQLSLNTESKCVHLRSTWQQTPPLWISYGHTLCAE